MFANVPSRDAAFEMVMSSDPHPESVAVRESGAAVQVDGELLQRLFKEMSPQVREVLGCDCTRALDAICRNESVEVAVLIGSRIALDSASLDDAEREAAIKILDTAVRLVNNANRMAPLIRMAVANILMDSSFN